MKTTFFFAEGNAMMVRISNQLFLTPKQQIFQIIPEVFQNRLD